jgi:Transposase DDE domain
MGPRSLPRTLRHIRQATLAQIEDRLGRFVPSQLFNPNSAGHHSRERIFTLSRTFWCFLWQMLQANTSLREVVRQVQSLFQLGGGLSVDERTGAYTQARSKLPLSMLHKALAATATAALHEAPAGVVLRGRSVKVVDGSTCRLADTPKNQKAFPQRDNQVPGCGFPIMRLVLLFGVTSGAILAVRVGSFSLSELALCYALLDYLKPQDILMGDRYFANFPLIALLSSRGMDFVGRVNTSTRRVDFRKGQRLGTDDRLFVWIKGQRVGQWLKRSVLAALPEQMTVRVVRLRVRQKGFRCRSLTLVTTLLDPVQFPAEEIGRAYLRRWRLELCLDDVKTTLNLKQLKCQTPKMAYKELLAGLIAYNLLRCLMAQAASLHQISLDRISFKGSLDGLRQFCVASAQARSRKARRELWDLLLKTLALDAVPARPGRREPRAVKLISKYDKLIRPRHLQKDRPNRNVRKSLSMKRMYAN